jgi:menaquinone-dependent protoporphyrinogen oxidase
MRILVAYGTKHGATQGIAERIAAKLKEAGQQVDVRRASDGGDLSGYDAFVIGSAAYMFHWRKDAVALVRNNRDLLASRPVWLFSSGPLGTEPTNAKGQDQREAAVPKEIVEFREALKPRDHRVFFGALSRAKFDFGERLLALLPVAKTLFPEGDFRDWADIDAWAEGIGRELAAGKAKAG